MDRGKILLLCDSNGREIVSLLKIFLGEKYNTFSFMKPNAKLNDVVESVNSLAKDFGRNDCILIVGGTNDVFDEKNCQTSIPEALNIMKRESFKTNVVLTEVPLNYYHGLFNTIVKVNRSVKRSISKAKRNKKAAHFQLMNLRFLRRQDFTRHGLHMNIKGKRKLVLMFMRIVKSMKKEWTCKESTSPNSRTEKSEPKRYKKKRKPKKLVKYSKTASNLKMCVSDEYKENIEKRDEFIILK